MCDNKPRFESMLFNYETTARTDYQFEPFKRYPETVYKPKTGCLMVRPGPLKDLHTLTDWKQAPVRFDLFHKPKEIVRENPRIVPQPFFKPADEERESVQKTRPRLVMTPAVSMDDIKDKTAREILCKDMYTSTVMKANAEGTESIDMSANVKSPFPGYPAPAKPIFLPKIREPYVAPEWRFETIEWDAKQLRSYVDQTKEFWINRKH